MSNQIFFATGNKGKVATLRRHIERLGCDIKVTQAPLELMEPQADTATEVAKAKVLQAYEQLQKPVLVDDSSFHIAALGGFPGPYIKYMLTTIGVEGILKFMEGRDDRSAYFLSSLVYIDERGETHVFEDLPYGGHIAEEIDDVENAAAWGDLHKVFLPEGSDKVLARMTPEDHARARQKQVNAYENFVLWLKTSADKAVL